ncbi:hypothetical protein CHS0354_005839, partial [Potamilus streckersoni]
MSEDWDEEIKTGVISVPKPHVSTPSLPWAMVANSRQETTASQFGSSQWSRGSGFGAKSEDDNKLRNRRGNNDDAFGASRGGRGEHMSRGRGRGFGRNDERGTRHTNKENQYRNRDSERSSAMTMSVPSSKVGRIIGKGGAKIRELQELSGARIK